VFFLSIIVLFKFGTRFEKLRRSLGQLLTCRVPLGEPFHLHLEIDGALLENELGARLLEEAGLEYNSTTSLKKKKCKVMIKRKNELMNNVNNGLDFCSIWNRGTQRVCVSVGFEENSGIFYCIFK